MRFRVLGSVEACVAGGAAVRLSRTGHRQVLATLALSAGRVVMIDSLIDHLWPDGPPDSARGMIKTYMWGLRRALAPADPLAAPIRTTGAGYQLLAGPDDLDLLAFARLAAAGRAALSGGDAAAAQDALGRALALWRGRALADARTPGALADAGARLDDERLGVAEDWAQARLLLGGHSTLIPALREWISASPLREPLWGQLILALYRSGRRAEATLAFHDLRRRLGEELGIEPGYPVRRLHQQILAEDPALLSGYR